MSGVGVRLENRHVRCGMRFGVMVAAGGCASFHSSCFVCVAQSWHERRSIRGLYSRNTPLSWDVKVGISAVAHSYREVEDASALVDTRA